MLPRRFGAGDGERRLIARRLDRLLPGPRCLRPIHQLGEPRLHARNDHPYSGGSGFGEELLERDGAAGVEEGDFLQPKDDQPGRAADPLQGLKQLARQKKD